MDGKISHGKDTDRVALTEAAVAALHAEIARTGVTPHVLLKDHLHSALGIGNSLLHRWLAGNVNSANRARYETVLEAWRSLPARDPDFVANAPEVRAIMRGHRERTSVGIVKLLASRNDHPAGLSVPQMENFYRGRIVGARREHIEYVIGFWQQLADQPRIMLTPKIRAALRAHIERTGKGPSAILRGAKGKPDGLKAAVIAKWLKGGVTAREDHFRYITTRYKAETAEA